MVSIEVCIPSRDGRIDDDVLMRAHGACEYAARRGVACELARVKDAYTVAACRNRGVAGFLTRSKTHLLFLDDDVLLPTAALELLAKAAERINGVICGCVPSVRIDQDGEVIGYVQVKPIGQDWLRAWPSEEVKLEACGGGCMMIPRSVFAALEFPWFRWPETYKPGMGVRAVTDDADFCNRVISLGHTVTAIPTIHCGHKKTIDVAMLIAE